MTARRLRTIGLLAALPALAAAQDIRAVPAYGSTLTFGTGLVSIPVAWVSKANGDLFANISTRRIGFGATPQTEPNAEVVAWDLTQSFDLHLGGRLSLGASLYGTKFQQIGLSGQFLVLQQPDNGPVWLPSIAFGVRNLGSSKYQDRFVTGERRVTDRFGTAGPGAQRGIYNGSPTIFGVATREFTLGKAAASFTLGYGNGLFKEDGGLDSLYSASGTLASGVFTGGRVSMPVNDRTAVALMVENNGFDWSLGGNISFGFISLGAYLTEVEEQGEAPLSQGSDEQRGRLANYPKFGLSLSYTSSLTNVLAGSRQRAEAADAQLELRRLSQEIAQRRATTRELTVALTQARAAADKAAQDQQAAIIRQLQAEQAALKAAAERLEALQKKPPENK